MSEKTKEELALLRKKFPFVCDYEDIIKTRNMWDKEFIKVGELIDKINQYWYKGKSGSQSIQIVKQVIDKYESKTVERGEEG